MTARIPRGGATFYGLPSGVDKPQTEPANATWGAQEIDNTFTVQALVSGLGSILKSPISGGVAVNYSANTTLAQINATGTRALHPDAILANSAVSTQITNWLKTGHLSVYVVNTALDTTNLSVKTTDSGGVAAAFGTTIKDCTTSNSGGSTSGGSTSGGSTSGGSTSGGSTSGGSTSGGSTSGGSTSGGSTSGGSTSGGSTSGGSTSGGSTGGGSTSGGSTSGGSTSGATSGGSTSGATGGGSTSGGTVTLQGCKTNTDSFTLTTTTPQVFATLTNVVTLQPDGTLFYNPAPQVTPGGFERSRGIPTQAATLSGKWKRESWPAK